ncbi:MAG TPA: hypothetical protein VHG90_04950 [Acidimicrobiales bacterium]|nr:hypothetical protein [Acidimicrobiales bacterium]
MTTASETLRFPFTVVDDIVHHLDTPLEAWSIETEVAVEGRLDDDRLRQAVGEALARHPMARARCIPARGTERSYTWELTEAPDLDPLVVVDCPDDAALGTLRDRLQSLSVPLAESPPLRMRLAHHPGGDRLMLNANHAAFDGFGCVRLLQSIGRAYTGDDDPQPDVDLADARDVERHLSADDSTVRLERLKTLADKLRDLAEAPARVAPEGGEEEAGYRIVHRSVPPEGAQRLSEIDHPGTVNDVLMAGLHLAIAAWNAEHGTNTGRVSVLMPMNLRPKEWSQEVVTNFVLMTRVSTTPADRISPSATLAAITGQTEHVKQWGTGASAIELLGRSARLPLWMKQSISPLLRLTGNRLVDTALLSNLGKIPDPPAFGSDAGPTTGLWFSAPARLPCGVSIGTASLGGALHLSVRVRRPLLGPDASQRFTDTFVAELARLAGVPASALGG